MLKIVIVLIILYIIYKYIKLKKKMEKDINVCKVISKEILAPLIEKNNDVEGLLSEFNTLQPVIDRKAIFYKSLEMIDLLDKKQKENVHMEFLFSCYLSCAIGETRVYLFQNLNEEKVLDKEKIYKIISSINSSKMNKAILLDFMLKAKNVKSIYKKYKEKKELDQEEKIIIEELLEKSLTFV